jgi:hypothetical protein
MASKETKEKIDISTLVILIREIGFNTNKKIISTKEDLLNTMNIIATKFDKPEMTENDLDFYIKTLFSLGILVEVGKKINNINTVIGWHLIW